MPNSLPKEAKAQFDHAVATFRGTGPVCITEQKLSDYLEHTQHIDATPAQRLRWLAIALENDKLERGYSGLQTIYQAAAKADPTDWRILHSWGMSASNWASSSVITPDSGERQAIAEEAGRVLHAALELSPKDSRIAHTLGLLYYNHPAYGEDPEKYECQAIDWFTSAVEWDGGNVMAQLYLAHCFHDRQDWSRAITEYAKVDLDRLARDWPAWRAVKCREQLAHCLAFAGQDEEAVRHFTAFLDSAASWDGEEAEDRIVNVDELVDAVMHKLDNPELLSRTRELVQHLAKLSGLCWLGKRYPHLLSS
jgi:hypothetical protein